MKHNKITKNDKMIAIENCLRGKMTKWPLMINDVAPDEETVFLRRETVRNIRQMYEGRWTPVSKV